MKKILSALALLVFSAFQLQAQDNRLDDFNFEELPSEGTDAPYVAAGGGGVVMPLMPNFDVLNTTVSAFLGGKTLSGPVLLFGGQGVVPFFPVPNMRVGFIAAGGGISEEAVVNDRFRRFEYNVSLNGLTFEYGIRLARGLVALPGIGGGWGRLNISAGEAPSSLDFSSFPSLNGSSLASMSAMHFYVQPNLNIEFSPIDLASIRVGVGYTATFMGDWRADRVSNSGSSISVANVPNDINGSGLSLQIGLFVGLFSR